MPHSYHVAEKVIMPLVYSYRQYKKIKEVRKQLKPAFFLPHLPIHPSILLGLTNISGLKTDGGATMMSPIMWGVFEVPF